MKEYIDYDMSFEFVILDYIHKLHSPIGDFFFKNFTRLGDSGIIWIVFIIGFLIYPKTRKLGIVLAISIIIEVIICNGILKPLVARIRPYELNTAITLLIDKQKDYSFPSGHSSAAFSFAVPLMILGLKKFWVPALVFAVLMAFSRMYLYVHYPTDIIGGMVIGTFSGIISCIICKKFFKIDKESL